MYHIEDETYASALNVGRQQERIEDSVASIQTALENLNAAQGEKEALQAQGQIASQGILEQNKATNALLTLIAVTATKNLAENAEKQATIKNKKNLLKILKLMLKELLLRLKKNLIQIGIITKILFMGDINQ